MSDESHDLYLAAWLRQSAEWEKERESLLRERDKLRATVAELRAAMPRVQCGPCRALFRVHPARFDPETKLGSFTCPDCDADVVAEWADLIWPMP